MLATFFCVWGSITNRRWKDYVPVIDDGVLTVFMDRLQVRCLTSSSLLVRHTHTLWTMMMWMPWLPSSTTSAVTL